MMDAMTQPGAPTDLSCRPWLQERIARWQRFYADPAPGQVMLMMAWWEQQVDVPIRPLASWTYPDEAEAYAEEQVRWLRAVDAQLRGLDEDRITTIKPSHGIAPQSTCISGAEVVAGADTTWVHPVLTDWADLERLRLDPGNRWVEWARRVNRRFLELCDGDFTVQTLAHFSPVDLANALRGNSLFTDLSDEPEAVHRLMRFSAEAIIWLERELRRDIPLFGGGSGILGTWVPGAVPFMSEDAADMCSPRSYARFMRPYTEQVSQAFGGCWIHHHAKGILVHPEIAKVDGLGCLEISLDPNCPRPIGEWRRLLRCNPGLPLMTRCTPAEAVSRLDDYAEGRSVIMLTGPLDESRQAMAVIRKRYPPR